MKQKKYYITLLLLVILIMISVLYYFALQSKHTNNDIFYLPGTYQFNLHTLDGDYLAILPPSTGENTGDFELYNNREHKMLFKGIYKIQNKGILSLYSNEKIIGTLVVVNKQYYFIDNLLEPKEIKKTSPVATQFTP